MLPYMPSSKFRHLRSPMANLVPLVKGYRFAVSSCFISRSLRTLTRRIMATDPGFCVLLDWQSNLAYDSAVLIGVIGGSGLYHLDNLTAVSATS